jgi:hypothetical protein
MGLLASLYGYERFLRSEEYVKKGRGIYSWDKVAARGRINLSIPNELEKEGSQMATRTLGAQ